MNELPKKRPESKSTTEWKRIVQAASAEKAAYLNKFEGRTVSEKYRLAQERAKAAQAELKRKKS